MPQSTLFLSRLFGLYCLIIAGAMLARRQFTVDAVAALLQEPPLLYILGVILLFAGLAMILAHNRWRGGPATVIVTVIGWLTLLKGVVFVGLSPLPARELYLLQLRFAERYYFYVVVTLALGAYLTYQGFKPAARATR
jgi:heme/copper-type cytochrome/quinol oxidase subunit 3